MSAAARATFDKWGDPMAGKGALPKNPAQRHRRQVVTTNVVTSDGQTHGPDLPFGYDWPAQTRIWWDTWRSSAIASELTDSDWQFLLDTALLHAELWAGNGAVAAELRLRVAKFGATPEDRQRLRMEIGTPEPAAAPKARRPNRLRVVDSA